MPDAKLIAPYRMFLDPIVGGWNKDLAAMVTMWGTNGAAIVQRVDDTNTEPNGLDQQHTQCVVRDWYFQTLNNQGVADLLGAVELWLREINALNQPDDSGSPGDLLNYQLAWHEINDVTKPVPLSYSQFTGDDPGISWQEWGTFGDSHVPQEIDGKWYRSTLVGQSGDPMPASVWWEQISVNNDQQTGLNRMIDQYIYTGIVEANAQPV